MKKEIYIKILKYVDDSPEGVTLNQLREKFDFSGKEAQIVWEQLTQGREGRAALLMHYSKQKDEHGNDYDLYTLSFEGVAFLLEYEELEQARHSSKWALRIASGALIVSIIVGLFQIFGTFENSERGAILRAGYANCLTGLAQIEPEEVGLSTQLHDMIKETCNNLHDAYE